MTPKEAGTAGTSQTSNPTGSNPSTSTETSTSKGSNPWADETVRNTSTGPVEVKPTVTPKTSAAPVTTTQVPGTTTTPATGTTAPAGGQPATVPQGQQPAQTQQPQTGQSLDPKALAREFAEETARIQREQTQQQQTAAPLTDEEYNQMFGVVNLNADDFTSIVGFAPERPEQVTALNNVLQRLNRQSVKMANYMAEQKIKALEDKFSAQFQPVLQQTQAQVEERVQEAFFGAYPGFKDYVPLLKEIKEGIQARKQQFNSVQELIDFVATKAATLIGKPVDAFKVAAAAANGGQQQTTQQQQTTGGSRQMTTTSVGGRVGGNNVATSKEKKTTAAALFSEE